MAYEILINFRNFALAAAIGVAVGMWSTAGHASTAEQRAACTPDAFRLASQIPNIDGITPCMRKNKSSLSSACRAVFDK